MSAANAVATLCHSVAPSSTSKLACTLRARHKLLGQWQQKCAAMRDNNRPLVWFHAPSVGEGLQARPVIDLLRTRRPDVQIAYTYFSPSAESFAASLNVDVRGYLPFDTINSAQAMIDMLKPSALFFSKLDVWPNLVRVARARNVVTGLLSATVAPGSGRMGALARVLLHDAYASLDIVGAIDSENATRLEQMGVRRERMSVAGDTRFDQVWERAQNVDRNSALLQSLRSSTPTLVAGSTWPADESVLLRAWLDVKAHVPHARLIIAPHEPTAAHVDPLESWSRNNNLTVTRLSALTSSANAHISAPSEVVIVDRTGVLGNIYAIADAAFVGGGFHKAGLHSVIEPAAYGIPVVFGPSYHMSREAGLLLEHGAAKSVTSVAECAAALTAYLTDATERARAGTAAMALVQTELGAAERSLTLVLGALDTR